MIEVYVSQLVVSSVPGRADRWRIGKVMRLAAPPRKGDTIELAYGWSADAVADTMFSDGGAVTVQLRTERTDSPDTLAELDRLVAEHGWERR